MEIKYPEIGICGLSCKRCPNYQATSKNPCHGCKSTQIRPVECPFISCAIKNHNVEFCWDCPEVLTCKLWESHGEFSLLHDTFCCYQTPTKVMSFEKNNKLQEFLHLQTLRTNLLKELLAAFDEGASASYYCTVATVFTPYEIKEALASAREVIKTSPLLSKKAKANLLHSILDKKAKVRGYDLKPRK
jgi:hypothetical protein